MEVTFRHMILAPLRYASRVGEDNHREEYQTAYDAVDEEYRDYGVFLERLFFEYVIKSQQCG